MNHNLWKKRITGPLILFSEFENFDIIENLIDRTDIYGRVSIFSEKDESNIINRISCDKININGFEDVSKKTFLNNLEYFGLDHVSNIQSIVDVK